MNDSEIIRKLKNREEEGLRGLIRQYTPYVTAILCNISRGILSLEDIEELAADVFWSVWSHSAGLQGRSAPKTLPGTDRAKCSLQQAAQSKGAPHSL